MSFFSIILCRPNLNGFLDIPLHTHCLSNVCLAGGVTVCEPGILAS